MTETIKFFKLKSVKTPTRGTPDSAGIDFYVPDDFGKCDIPDYEDVLRIGEWVEPGDTILIPSGLKAKLPKGYALVMMNKSGVAVKKNFDVLACVIDEDYQGEIHFHFVNAGKHRVFIQPGEKIVQGLLLPVGKHDIEIMSSEEELYGGEKTTRGEGGFGSTGVK